MFVYDRRCYLQQFAGHKTDICDKNYFWLGRVILKTGVNGFLWLIEPYIRAFELESYKREYNLETWYSTTTLWYVRKIQGLITWYQLSCLIGQC